MSKLRVACFIPALCLASVALLGGCPLQTNPAAAVLEGDWYTPVAGVGEAVITFDATGTLVKAAVTQTGGATVTQGIFGSHTTVTGDDVNVQVPVGVAKGTFTGTLSADKNTLTGNLSQEIRVGATGLSVPSGEITLKRTADCNNNGVYDHRDIAAGTSQDANADGVPDECASE